jgi:hypothetical protein
MEFIRKTPKVQLPSANILRITNKEKCKECKMQTMKLAKQCVNRTARKYKYGKLTFINF